MEVFDLSIFKYVFNNKSFKVNYIDKKELNCIFSNLQNLTNNIFDKNKPFFGKIIFLSYFKLTRWYTVSFFSSSLNKEKLYSIKGIVNQKSIVLNYNFAFYNLLYFILVLFIPLFFIIKSIHSNNLMIFIIAIIYYIIVDFIFNTILYFNLNKFHNNFIKYLKCNMK